MSEAESPYTASNAYLRWLAFALLVGFVAMRVRDHDYWGAAYGACVAAGAVLKPTSGRAMSVWRRNAIVGLTIFFALLVASSVWAYIAGPW
jgi:hypothetical protein